MDGVGTMEMARAFKNQENGLSVALHKHYSLDKLTDFYTDTGQDNIWYSMGVSERDEEKLDEFLKSKIH